MSYIKVKPVKDKMIRNPITQVPIKVEGEKVRDNSFWRRRIADGDVIKVEKQIRSSSTKSKGNSLEEKTE